MERGEGVSAAELIERYSEDKQLETLVIIPPHLLRSNLAHVVQDRLIKKIQGRCTSKDGFIIKLKKVVEIIGGSIEPQSGSVKYRVKYIAQCLRPHDAHLPEECNNLTCTHTGDIVEAYVTQIFQIGIFADLGALSIFIPSNRLPPNAEFQPDKQRFVLLDGTLIKPHTLIGICIEKIEMLDDNYLPAQSTASVLKAMGRYVENSNT